MALESVTPNLHRGATLVHRAVSHTPSVQLSNSPLSGSWNLNDPKALSKVVHRFFGNQIESPGMSPAIRPARPLAQVWSSLGFR
jgi:hypothetical protein